MTTSTKWFYQYNQTVKGPLTTTELKNLIPSMSDLKNTYVWSRGHSDWISADRWQPSLEMTEQQLSSQKNTRPVDSISATEVKKFDKPNFSPVPHTPFTAAAITDVNEFTKTNVPLDIMNDHEKTNPLIEHVANHADEEKFRVQVNFVDQAPMTKSELMSFAGKSDDPAQIAIFDNVSKEWKEIYAFKDIVEKLGLTRRKHPRVPILAQFTGSSSRHEKFNARLVTISIGGLGLTDVFDLKIGDKIYGQITSPHFYSPVTIEAEATYCGNDGYVGLKFSQINDDSQSLVTDYVKRFS